MSSKKSSVAELKAPSVHNWRTTDDDELNRRRLRAVQEGFRIVNRDPEYPIFSNFKVESPSGMSYSVEIRSVCDRHFACDCVDFRINGLGTCKHVEATLQHLDARFPKLFAAASVRHGSPRIEVFPDRSANTLRAANGSAALPPKLRVWFDDAGQLLADSPEEALPEIQTISEVRISQEVKPWLEQRQRAAERKRLRREYQRKVQQGEWPPQETLVPLFPYQREGMLHLAFTERALLADEMGLGKTIQAIAACALLHRLGKAQRVLVVTPASLKTEWEDQIQRFTTLPYQLVYGSRHERLIAYDQPPFFTIVNYEQMLIDALDVNKRLRPDIVVLDEAQRIKNWSTKTTQAIKRLRSRYAFVLTGTPIENRIDELYSLMDFLDPEVLGPLFRFNREYYELDERGRPKAYQNLKGLHDRIAPYMLRRRKSDVETELPERTDRNHFVPMSSEQQTAYEDREAQVARLAMIAKRRPLTQQEQEKMLRELAMMRMLCDTNYILDPQIRICPKLKELEKVLEECRDNGDVKVIVFSEWERMLELVKELCDQLKIGYAWHTGSVPQRRRRAEINCFKSEPSCKVFLSTDSGASGLNLQNASVVINCDLPWNPAKLEQRIARAWRKNQSRPVTVINLVSENTIEHRMLETLRHKQALSDGVLDLRGNLNTIQIRTGRQAFMAKLEQLLSSRPAAQAAERKKPLPVDRALAFAQTIQKQLNGSLLKCEERYPRDAAHSVICVVVDKNPALWRERLSAVHQQYFGPEQSDPLAPVQLEIIDRSTEEALERLQAAGLLTLNTRAIRPLTEGNRAPLSADEQQKAVAFRQRAVRKLKMTQVLSQGDLQEEARVALLDVLLALGRALAVENRLPEPTSVTEAILPPLTACWKEAFQAVSDFAGQSANDMKPAITAVSDLLKAE